MPRKSDFEVLIAELTKDRSVLDALVKENAPAWGRVVGGATDSLDFAALAQDVDELRAFRHVFRNLYQTSLSPERIRSLQAVVERTIPRFVDAHTDFLQKIRAAADRL